MALTRLPSFTLLNTDSYTFGNANVSGNISAGNLKTDHLLYANGAAWQLSSYSDSNVATYLPTYTGNVAANYFIGNGSSLTSINGANVTGQVSFAAVANSVAVANVSGIGNIATLNLDGNTSNILYGNGVFAGAPVTYANSNVAAYLPTYTGNVAAGNILTDNLLYANGTAWQFSNYANTNVAAYLPTYTGNITAGNITVSGKTILSNVSNVTITGGLSNQLLQTDGQGNLSWVTPTGTTITVDNFTGNGVETQYTLSVTPANEAYTMVAMAGTLQPRTVYSLSGNVITFSSAPPATAPIEVTTFSSVMGYGTSDIVANSFTANTLTANTLSGNIVSSSSNLAVNTLSANSITNTGTGIPTINSATSINFTASTVVRTTSSPFQFYNCSSTVRDTIAASNGYVIYNTTTNKLQVYANGSWVDLH